MLLLNDKYDPNWQVWVDGQPAPLLRCNFIMRGVSLTPGEHTVEFHFLPPAGSLYVSLAAVALGLILCGVLVVARERPAAAPPDLQDKPPAGSKTAADERDDDGARCVAAGPRGGAGAGDVVGALPRRVVERRSVHARQREMKPRYTHSPAVRQFWRDLVRSQLDRQPTPFYLFSLTPIEAAPGGTPRALGPPSGPPLAFVQDAAVASAPALVATAGPRCRGRE